MYRKTAKKLLKFIEKSPTAFQAVTEMTKRLDKEGFEELKEEDHWKLKKGGNYYVTRNHSAIIALYQTECRALRWNDSVSMV